MNKEKMLGLLVVSVVMITLIIGISSMVSGANEQGLKVGFVDMEKLQQQHPLVELIKEITTKADKDASFVRAQAQLELGKVSQNLDQEMQQQLKTASSDAEKASIQSNYQDLWNAEQKRAQSKVNTQTQQIQAQAQKDINQLTDQLKAQMASVGKEKEVDLLLSKEAFFYAKNSVDLTQDVIDLGKKEAEKANKTNKDTKNDPKTDTKTDTKTDSKTGSKK